LEAHLLSLNSFNRPKVLSANDAAYTNLIYLIMLTKGKYQSHPNMGVGIRERYRHSNDTNMLITLRQDIRDQIEQYLPEITVIDVSFKITNHVLGIIIDTTSGAYVLAYNSDTEGIEAGASYVLDDL
jgi:hypothetical protein